MEHFRPLLPIGYDAGARAYLEAVEGLDATTLSQHYTTGLSWFHEHFTPTLKARLQALSGGVWDLGDYRAFAAGSDVDLMTHIVEAVAQKEGVALFPSGWYGFKVGCTNDDNINFTTDARGKLACLCVPSVRNGHLTAEMVEFLAPADAVLLNINLYPTLSAKERAAAASALAPTQDRSILSVSFSRGFGLTASQLGVALVHKDHPYIARFERQWSWHTYFFNTIAARAFLAIDVDAMQAVDQVRREYVSKWLADRGLPVVESGTYYVKTFRPDGPVPDALKPLLREDVLRLCFKPPYTGTP